MRTHTVQPGERLSAIAAHYRVPVRALLDANPTKERARAQGGATVFASLSVGEDIALPAMLGDASALPDHAHCPDPALTPGLYAYNPNDGLCRGDDWGGPAVVPYCDPGMDWDPLSRHCWYPISAAPTFALLAPSKACPPGPPQTLCPGCSLARQYMSDGNCHALTSPLEPGAVPIGGGFYELPPPVAPVDADKVCPPDMAWDNYHQTCASTVLPPNASCPAGMQYNGIGGICIGPNGTLGPSCAGGNVWNPTTKQCGPAPAVTPATPITPKPPATPIVSPAPPATPAAPPAAATPVPKSNTMLWVGLAVLVLGGGGLYLATRDDSDDDDANADDDDNAEGQPTS